MFFQGLFVYLFGVFVMEAEAMSLLYGMLMFISCAVTFFLMIGYFADDDNKCLLKFIIALIFYMVIFIHGTILESYQQPTEVNYNLTITKIKNNKNFNTYDQMLKGKWGNVNIGRTHKISDHGKVYYDDTTFTERYYPARWSGLLWFPETCTYKDDQK